MKVRYLIKFTKEKDIKFISHLDLMRTIQRIIRRASLPIEYSKGFNPHMNVSIAQPLSVGMYSSGEYMDAEFAEYVDESYIKDKLNENSPLGIKFLEAVLVENKEGKKVSQSAALIDVAKYNVIIKYGDTSVLKEEIDGLLEQNEWQIVKKSKSGEKLVNIKSLIRDFKYDILNNKLVINCTICCGSKKNLSAELLSQFIKNNTSGALKDSFVDIAREELYVEDNSKITPIDEFIKDI